MDGSSLGRRVRSHVMGAARDNTGVTDVGERSTQRKLSV